jgi:hypothetical protein
MGTVLGVVVRMVVVVVWVWVRVRVWVLKVMLLPLLRRRRTIY